MNDKPVQPVSSESPASAKFPTPPASSAGFHSGFVALVGRPSAGKSTLLNALCGEKVAIISPKPQTTRNVIRGIVNRPSAQFVFLDTPGFTENEDFLSTQLREELRSAVRKAEAILYLLDLSRPVPASTESVRVGEYGSDGQGQGSVSEEEGLLSLLRDVLDRQARPLCLALNKTDLLPDAAQRQQRIAEYLKLVKQYFPDLPMSCCFELSAKKEDGLEEVLQHLCLQVPEGEPLYDTDVYTDQEPQFRIRELIREQALSFCGRELPYALYVEVVDLEYRPFAEFDNATGREAFDRKACDPKAHDSESQSHGQDQGQDQGLWVRAFLQVERESQKGILIGKGGNRIREIRKRSTKAVRMKFGCPVQLDLQVKVDYKWRRKHR
ncbi:GTPase Era [Candidatus Haliotispira prima]|uniref:GTPase Era n=1 Tax=Candidatus Haliotispira prima TaxID=3034016 RepID=A0ABY8MHA5_9SPIO|nr:GTPase Era [Candidatus Haliotispira prima]